MSDENDTSRHEKRHARCGKKRATATAVTVPAFDLPPFDIADLILILVVHWAEHVVRVVDDIKIFDVLLNDVIRKMILLFFLFLLFPCITFASNSVWIRCYTTHCL